MLTTILAFVLGLFVSDGEADALRVTAPIPNSPGRYYLTTESAREHIAAASAAAMLTNMDADLILSLAHHESRYDHRVRNPREPGGMVSCGVMTPEPMHPEVARHRCVEETASLAASYLAGAKHLRRWFDDCSRSLGRCGARGRGLQRGALLGFAGGWRAIDRCNTRGVVWIRPGVDGCRTPEVFLWRVRMIERSRDRASRIEARS